MSNLNLMDYPGDTPPFQPGDMVECIEDRKAPWFNTNWVTAENIKNGDWLKVKSIDRPPNPMDQELQWIVYFEEKILGHSARLFRKVEGGEK